MKPLQLKNLEPKDLPLLANWLSQAYIQAIFGEPEEWLSEIQENIKNADWVKYFLIQKDAPIGFCQYYDTQKAPPGIWSNEQPNTLGIDYFIGVKSLLGKGLGTEAVRLLLDKIKRNTNVKYVIADPEPENLVSVKLLKKFGFRKIENGLYQLILK